MGKGSKGMRNFLIGATIFSLAQAPNLAHGQSLDELLDPNCDKEMVIKTENGDVVVDLIDDSPYIAELIPLIQSGYFKHYCYFARPDEVNNGLIAYFVWDEQWENAGKGRRAKKLPGGQYELKRGDVCLSPLENREKVCLNNFQMALGKTNPNLGPHPKIGIIVQGISILDNIPNNSLGPKYISLTVRERTEESRTQEQQSQKTLYEIGEWAPLDNFEFKVKKYDIDTVYSHSSHKTNIEPVINLDLIVRNTVEEVSLGEYDFSFYVANASGHSKPKTWYSETDPFRNGALKFKYYHSEIKLPLQFDISHCNGQSGRLIIQAYKNISGSSDKRAAGKTIIDLGLIDLGN